MSPKPYNVNTNSLNNCKFTLKYLIGGFFTYIIQATLYKTSIMCIYRFYKFLNKKYKKNIFYNKVNNFKYNYYLN